MSTAVFEGILISLFSIVLVHGIRRYSVKRLLLAFTLIAVIVTIEENCAMFLTNNYTYHGYHLWIGQFPAAIMLAWIVVSYLGFLVATKVNNVTLGAFTASLLDLALEPAAAFFGLWVWRVPAPYPTIYYFGAPTGNAVGWFLLTLLGTIILKKTIGETTT